MIQGRTIALGVLLAVLCVYSQANDSSEWSEYGISYIEECRKENKLKSSQIKEAIKNFKLPETENGKCFVGCVMEKNGALEDGKFYSEIVKEYNNLKLMEKPDILEKANFVIDKCAAQVVNSGEKCEYAANLFECAFKYGKEMGVPASTFL